MKTLDEALIIARKKYFEAIRGKEYQEQLMESQKYDEDEHLYRRKEMFTAEIALLEDVFSAELLQSNN